MSESNLLEGLGDQIRNAIKEVVEQNLESKHVKIDIEYGSKVGDNFAGVIYRLFFKNLENNNGNNAKDSATNCKKLILKVAPQNIARRETFNSRGLFLCEINLYEKVLSEFQKFQVSKGIDIDVDGFNEYPKCYKTIDIEPSECLFLQDLKEDQFEMMDYSTGEMTLEHVQLVMKTLGKFHAVSFAMKDQQPTKFKAITSELNNQMRLNVEHRDFFSVLNNRLLACISDGNNEGLLMKLNQLNKKHPFDILKYCLSEELAEPYSVVCHGDCWINNIMFKNDKDKQPNKVRILDWQFASYASPVVDLIFFLVCVTKELRDEHYDDFLKVYHASLSDMLMRLGSDPKKVYPYEAMQEQFLKFGKLSIVCGSLLLSILTIDTDKVPDMDEVSADLKNGKEYDIDIVFKQSKKSKQLYEKEIRALVAHAARLGFI